MLYEYVLKLKKNIELNDYPTMERVDLLIFTRNFKAY